MGWVGWDVNVHAHVMLMMLRCSWGGVGWDVSVHVHATLMTFCWSWGVVGWDILNQAHVTLKLFHGWSSFWEVQKQACKAACPVLGSARNPLKTTRRLSAPFPSSWIQSASSFIRLLTAPHRWDFCYGHPRFFWRWTLRGPPQQMWKLHRERDYIYIYITLYIYTLHIYIYTVYI